jgi:hypothetical protein
MADEGLRYICGCVSAETGRYVGPTLRVTESAILDASGAVVGYEREAEFRCAKCGEKPWLLPPERIDVAPTHYHPYRHAPYYGIWE